MYLNDFSVRIPEGVEEPGGYVALEHNTPYRLVLGNKRDVRCDAKVEIDGQCVGTCRLNANSSVTLERPEHDTGRFTFYRLGTEEAQKAALKAGDQNTGLVKVTFTPEWDGGIRFYYGQRYHHPLPWVYCFRCKHYPCLCPAVTWTTTGGSTTTYDVAGTNTCNTSSTLTIGEVYDACRSAGGTGLSGQSEQEYRNADAISLDYSQQTTIYLRLVCGRSPKAYGPRPLTCTANPVPPPVA